MANTENSANQRSAGWRILHSVLCILGTLLLMFCFSTASAVRYYACTDKLAESLAYARLSDAAVPFSGKTVSEYIRDEYAQDERVLPEDVGMAVDEMELPALLSEKIGIWSAMLRGDTDEVVQFSTDAAADALNGSRELLYRKCLLVIEDSDVEAVREQVGGIFGKLNSAADALYGSPAGRSLARFRISPVLLVLYLGLIGLILRRWMSVMEQSGKTDASAIRGMAWTILIPSLIGFLLVAVTGIHAAFVRDGVVGLYGVTNTLRVPYWRSTAIGLAAGTALLFAVLLPKLREQKKQAASYQNYEDDYQHGEAGGRLCVSCGKPLDADAKFCIYCGSNQETGKAKSEPKQPEPKQPEPKKTEPKQAAPKKAEPKKPEPEQTDPANPRPFRQKQMAEEALPGLDFDWGESEPQEADPGASLTPDEMDAW